MYVLDQQLAAVALAQTVFHKYISMFLYLGKRISRVMSFPAGRHWVVGQTARKPMSEVTFFLGSSWQPWKQSFIKHWHRKISQWRALKTSRINPTAPRERSQWTFPQNHPPGWLSGVTPSRTLPSREPQGCRTEPAHPGTRNSWFSALLLGWDA